jgi:alkylated DNA repair dioxygenase AlkB
MTNTLFSLDPVFPEGFSYYQDFLSTAQEQQLLEEISAISLHPFYFQGYLAKRRVASFGYDYSFDKRSLTKGQEIPPAFNTLVEKAAMRARIDKNDFSELLVTQYPPGSVINWHRDAFPFDVIAGISLLSDCLFRLRPQDKTKQNRKSVISFTVTRRSLYIIQGPARWEWQHSIAPVKAHRYSITLRTLKKLPDA